MGKPFGPGPAAYGLPPVTGFPEHDGTRLRNPQYSFGLKTSLAYKQKAPGPDYSLEQMNQHGPPHRQAWSFGLKTSLPYKPRAPGPGAHRPEDCPVFKTSRPPTYSFGLRTFRKGLPTSPAPNAYALGSALGGYKFSMAKRLDLMGKTKSPGPAAYALEKPDTNQYKYSMGGRYTISSRDKKPGPAEYGPNLYMPGDAAFKFSFGTKHNEWTSPMFVEADNVDCKETYAKDL